MKQRVNSPARRRRGGPRPDGRSAGTRAPAARRRSSFAADRTAPRSGAATLGGLPPTRIDALAGEYLDDLRARDYRPSTLRAYRKTLARLRSFWRSCPSAGALLRAFASLRPATRATYLASGRAFDAWAVEGGHVRRRQLADRARVRVERAAPRPISSADLVALDRALAYPPGRDRTATVRASRRTRLLYGLLRATGARIGEVLSLRWTDVILDAGAEGLRLRRTKGRRDRFVPLLPGPVLTELRRRARTAPPTDYVVTNGARGDRPLTYSGALAAWNTLTRRAGVRATIHQIRHTRATELASKGMRLFELQRVLGHARTETTSRYAEVTEQNVRAELRRAEEARP